MKFLKIIVPVFLFVMSANASATTVASSIMDNTGEWSIGNSVNQFIDSGVAGLNSTAGTQVMHFNSSSSIYSKESTISFSNLSVDAGIYTAMIDVGSFTNLQLASVDFIGLTSNGVLLSPSTTTQNSPSAGSWETWVFEYVVSSGSNLIGSSLGFLIDVSTNGYSANIAFDNFNLDFQAAQSVPLTTPVPAAAWLFGSALLGFFGFSRRKANA